MNAREFLENRKINVITEVDARKEKIDVKGAWQLLKDASRVYVGMRGNFSLLSPGVHSREEIMSQAMGRSGNLRAPALKVGDIYLIGFAEEMYNSTF